MIKGPAPLRVLALIVGGWTAARLLILLPVGGAGEAVEPPLAPSAGDAAVPVPFVQMGAPSPLPVPVEMVLFRHPAMLARSASVPTVAAARAGAAFVPSPAVPPPFTAPLAAAAPAASGPQATELAVFTVPPGGPAASRWSGSFYLFLRDGGGEGSLGPNGTLGGSQAGGRVAYRIMGPPDRALYAVARLYVPLDRPEGAEVAAGIEWQPVARVPLRILAERRQRLGPEGRSDFALMVHGGGDWQRGRLRLEAYGQAGGVGVDNPDLFADGLVRATVRTGPVDIGAGAWGGAQPGVARVDIGPHLSSRLQVGGATLRASAEWRFRVAGDAAPASGPALTPSTDF